MPKRLQVKDLSREKILVTGGTGFLGRHLISGLRRLSIYARPYEDDIRLIDSFKPRYPIVYHLAGINKTGSGVGKQELIDVNALGTSAVMRYCVNNDARCVFASSSAVYRPLKRDGLLGEMSRRQPVTAYGLSKMMAEDICADHARRRGVSVTILRIFNLYGRGQDDGFLIPYIVSRLSLGLGVALKTPFAVRDFIHVLDVARAFMAARLRQGRGGLSVFNVGTGRGTNVHDAAGLMAAGMNIEPRIIMPKDGIRDGDYVVANIDRIEKVLGWKPRISIEAGSRMFCGKAPGVLK